MITGIVQGQRRAGQFVKRRAASQERSEIFGVYTAKIHGQQGLATKGREKFGRRSRA